MLWQTKRVSCALAHFDYVTLTLKIATATVSFSSCQLNLIKTFQIEDTIALITKMDLIFS